MKIKHLFTIWLFSYIHAKGWCKTWHRSEYIQETSGKGECHLIDQIMLILYSYSPIPPPQRIIKEMKEETKKVVINRCYGGFGLSDAAYQKLIELGIPVRKYITEKRRKNGLYKKVAENEGEVIFDKELTPEGEDIYSNLYWKYGERGIEQRYWETWIENNREHPLLIKAIEELGDKANSKFSELRIVKIPANIKYTIEEYDGLEHIAEVHKTYY